MEVSSINQAPHSWGFLFVGGWVDLGMRDKIIIQDNRGRDVSVDAKTFLKHIKEFHHSGVSVHEERGHYFTVDDNFRKMLDKKINDND